MLRAMQMAARYNLALAPETAALCQSIADTFGELPIERVWGEWDKWATQSVHLSRGIAVLVETGWLRHFPEIASTISSCVGLGFFSSSARAWGSFCNSVL